MNRDHLEKLDDVANLTILARKNLENALVEVRAIVNNDIPQMVQICKAINLIVAMSNRLDNAHIYLVQTTSIYDQIEKIIKEMKTYG